MADSLYLFVGLGNPGDQYVHTRHNVGFMMLDALAAEQGAEVNRSKMQGRYCRLRLHGAQAILLEPQTYMNRSGECVRRFVDYFNIPLSRVLVLHDDLDLGCGRIKAVARGGAGGHNGIKSLVQHLGSADIARLKIGISHPRGVDGQGRQPVERYVLSPFSPEQRQQIEERLPLVQEAIRLFIQEGIGPCMNGINGRGAG
ncbi:aminoacyl-tRNA hydrolase [Desulfogranum mediterraneum]|uniref:aminoacyl-tRNA hydrolase n=1 Tax=Desulfogranum mediterraneum TaxID=160661 RepID=UPI0003F63941|nr:aminoacyl-tRNA hydrolase [Desulfogranum mediterraneum]